MSVLSETVGFIGAGNMADALIRGIVGRGVVPRDRIWATNRSNRPRLLGLQQRYGVRTTPVKPPLLDASNVLIVAVKPKDMPEVLGEIHGAVRADQLVISVAAGVPLKAIERQLGGVPVVRAMPNTSAAVQASVTALAPGRSATHDHVRISSALFRAVGEVLTLPETTMDVVTGLSGSGPAYIYRFIEALIAAGTELGLSEQLAKQLAVHTLVGAARMLSEPDADSVELRRRVTSPGGTTQAGLTALEERGFASAVKEAVRRAAERAAELAEEHNKGV